MSYLYPASYYDSLQDEQIYTRWFELAKQMIAEHAVGKINTVLDLACGTGRLTELFAQSGYDMSALDLSPEMLSRAAERLRKFTDPDVLLVCDDMRSFELNDVVDMTVCALDSFNYLPSKKDLEKAFSRIALFMRGEGLLVFDMNTPYKFREYYNKNDFVLESENLTCTWQSEIGPSGKWCDFYLSFFAEREDGLYTRTDEEEREYIYSEKTVLDALHKSGFGTAYIYSTDDFGQIKEYNPSDMRMFICALRDKR